MTREYPNHLQKHTEFIVIILMNLIVWPMLVLWTLSGIVLSPLAYLVFKSLTRRSTETIIRLFVWVYGKGWLIIMAPFIRFRREGFKAHDTRPPCVMVINHLSFFDTYCLGLMPFSNVVLAIRNWPFNIFPFRPFMRLAGYLNVEMTHWDDIYDRAEGYLQSNAAIVFFPEGHRSRDGRPQRFYSGAFKVAIQAKATLIPLCIQGTDMLLPPGRRWLKPATITLKALEPIDVKSFSGPVAHRELSKLVKKRIQWAMGLPEDTDRLVPHQKPMRMIDQLAELTEVSGSVNTRIRKDNLFLDNDGKLGETALLEMMAQSFAATKGYMDAADINKKIPKRRHGNIRIHGGSGIGMKTDHNPVSSGSGAQKSAGEGLLVGIRKFNVYHEVMIGDELNIRVNITKRFGDFIMAKGVIHRGTGKIASADIKLWVPETGVSTSEAR